MAEADDEAAAFYEDPANREPAGPPVKRRGQTQQEREQALQELADLTQELGLYDTCAFCGGPLPCPSHRPGG